MTTEARFTWIAGQRGRSVGKMCRVLMVSRSGYYAWRSRGQSARSRMDQAISREIVRIHQEIPSYGLDPMVAEIRQKLPCSRNRVHRLKKRLGIVSARRRRYKATTQAAHKLPVADNLLRRDFTATAPNQKWVGDMTYIGTGEGWVYLATLKDVFTRQIVGWACSDRIDMQLALAALYMAVRDQRPPAGLIHHTDRGVQYCSHDYQQALQRYGILCSMSRKGDPYDNAVAENFFSCFKCEALYLHYPRTRKEAELLVFRYIEGFYNRRRRHAALDYLSPLAFRRRFELLALDA